MAPKYSTNVILKILSGIQSGVDIALADGDYVLGSGNDVDIQIFDVALSPQHAKLIVRNGKVSITALGGSLRTRSGMRAEAGGKTLEVLSLDLIMAGTTRFAVAPADANWAELNSTMLEGLNTTDFLTRQGRWLAFAREKKKSVVAASAAILVLGYWVFPHSMLYISDWSKHPTAGGVQAIENAIRAFDFAERLKVETNPDGLIHIQGFLDTKKDRQAIVDALHSTGINTQTDIVVLDTLRAKITALIDENAPEISFTLSPTGDITLKGLILDDKKAENILQLLKDNADDAVSIHSDIQTGSDLLNKVVELSGQARLSPFINFQLDESVIEATGAISKDRLDAWAGFLQAYAHQFAEFIPLRSLVQLQTADGTPVGPAALKDALYLAADNVAEGLPHISIERLKNGSYTAADLLIGGSDTNTVTLDKLAQAVDPLPSRARSSTPSNKHVNINELLQGIQSIDSPNLNALAVKAIQLWESKKLLDLKDGTPLSIALDSLNQSSSAAFSTISDYTRQLRKNSHAGTRSCWSGSKLTMGNITGALFWLDVLSHDSGPSITSFDENTGGLLVEAALNPLQTAACAHLVSDGHLNSRYLAKSVGNPNSAVAMFETGQSVPLKITGISLSTPRYFQTSTGMIFKEGDRIDPRTNVLTIGETGVAFTRTNGFAIAMFGTDLSWQSN